MMMNVSRLIGHINQMPGSQITYSMLKILSADFSTVSLFMVIKRQKWTKNSKLRQDVEAVRRWKEENDRLFGPILKTSKIDPLGKKTRGKKLNVVVGKDLDEWFDKHYPPQNIHSETEKGDNSLSSSRHEETHSETEKEENKKDNFVPSSLHKETVSGVNDTWDSKDSINKDILAEILRCNITAEISPALEQLQSRLNQSPFPSLPTVTGILAKTRSPQSQFFLDRWKAKMIDELGEEGFKRHQTETLQRGINLHSCIQQLLSGVDIVERRPDNQGFWTSIQHVIPAIEEVQALENRVMHPYLHYAGTYDCVATYKDVVCLIDWKTSQKPKPHLSNTFDYPLQVCAYIGAYNAEPSNTVKLDSGLVVVAYPDGTPAHAHYISPDQCQYYWKQWLDRLHQYWNSIFYPGQNTG